MQPCLAFGLAAVGLTQLGVKPSWHLVGCSSITVVVNE